MRIKFVFFLIAICTSACADGAGGEGAASDGVASDGVASDGVASDGVASDGDGETGEVEDIARIASNALTPTQLWGSNLVSGALTTANLQTMAVTANGRATLQYAIACALAPQQQVSVNVNGIVYTYKGVLAIASAWTSTALSASEQRWVTACLLSLVNSTGTPLTVSLRGGALALEAGEASTYPVEEGAFWGNLFLGESSYASACNGIDQAARDVGTTLPLRECAEDDAANPGTTPCGFAYAGLCTDVCSSSSWYGGCDDGIHGATSNVVTAYVAP